MPERSSISTEWPARSSTAATFRIPRLMKTRSSRRKDEGGITMQTLCGRTGADDRRMTLSIAGEEADRISAFPAGQRSPAPGAGGQRAPGKPECGGFPSRYAPNGDGAGPAVSSLPVQVRIKNADSGTYPCVFHHAGGDSICRSGLELKRRYIDLIGEPNRRFRFSKNGRVSGVETYLRPRTAATIRKLPKLSIVTFTSFRFPGSAELSLLHQGVQVDVIRPPGAWRNIRKIGLMRRYLDSVGTEYVLSLDSHDAFVTEDIHGVVQAFEKLGCRMLVQADAHNWPESEESRSFYDAIAGDHRPFRYFCGGVYIGDVAFLKRFFDISLATEPVLPNDDQGPYKEAFQKLHPECQLDYRCELFQSLTDYCDERRPGKFEAVDLNLELQYRTGTPAPASKAITPGKLSAALPYFLGRLLDPVADRLLSHRRPG